jgi:hypothetical protein
MLEVEARRVADRLRVLGPRWVERGEVAGPAAAQDVRRVLQRLADLGAQAEGRPVRAVPELGLHALADQLLVLVADVEHQATSAACALAADWLTGLRTSLP